MPTGIPLSVFPVSKNGDVPLSWGIALKEMLRRRCGGWVPDIWNESLRYIMQELFGEFASKKMADLR